MSKAERKSFREALLSGIEPPDELRERFDEQIKTLLRRRLCKAEKVRDILLAVVFLAVSGFFGWAFYMAVTVHDRGVTSAGRLFMCVAFALGAIGFFAGATYAVLELRSGRVAPRSQQQASIAIPVGFVLLICTMFLVFARQLGQPTEDLLFMGVALLFYWIMAVGFVLAAKSQWQHEDALLEQKRTQLEIALLREDLKDLVCREPNRDVKRKFR